MQSTKRVRSSKLVVITARGLRTLQVHFIFINPPRMRRRVTVVGSVCVSVKSHLTSGVSVRPENPVTYSADNGGCGVSPKTARLQRSSTPESSIEAVGHFPAESAHAYLTTPTR